MQAALLELLFIVLVQTPERKAPTSHALVRGSILASFGTVQATRQYWESDSECEILQDRIRDTLILIAVESTGLSSSLAGPSEDDPAQNAEGSLVSSKAHIEFVNQLILDASEGEYDEDEKTVRYDDSSPVALLCLAWSIVLRTLPQNLAPSFSHGEESVPYQEVASRAFDGRTGLFAWMERILTGPLFPESEDTDVTSATTRKATNLRRIFKDLLVGTTELLNVENIPDQVGLYKAWETTFGTGGPGMRIMLAADFWQVDYPSETRRAVLEQARYPFQPGGLLNALRALSVPEINESVSRSLFGLDVTHCACDFLNGFPNATFVTPTSAYTVAGLDQTGRKMVRSTQPLVLPGGVEIPRGTTGLRLTNDDMAPVISWSVVMPGWKMLVETMRAAAGLSATPSEVKSDGAVYLTVEDLFAGTEPPSSTDVLLPAFRFLTSILRRQSSLTLELLGATLSSQTAIHPLVEVTLAVLCDFSASYDPNLAVEALKLLQSLVLAPDTRCWQALKASAFFGGYGRKRCPAASLLQLGAQLDHSITIAMIQLVSSLAEASSASHMTEDNAVLKAALTLLFNEAWSFFPGWRYEHLGRKFEVGALLFELYDTILRHPFSRQTNTLTPTAESLLSLFITSASPLTYRPIIDVVTQATSTLRGMISRHRETEARWIVDSVDKALQLLSTLFRLASSMKTPLTALPYGILGATVISPSSHKVQLFDYLLELTSLPSTQPYTTLLCLKTARTYLEAIAGDPKRPSVAGLLRDPAASFDRLASLTGSDSTSETQAAAWQLLATIITTQQGCATAVVLEPEADNLAGVLKLAEDYILKTSDTYTDEPHVVTAALAFVQAVLDCPSLDTSIVILRKNQAFWEAMYEIANRLIPSPPTFQLSMHADDFASRIWQYAYSVQAKANATAVLSAELGLSVDYDEGRETKTQSLVLGLFRSPAKLTEAAALAVHSSCEPRVHEDQLERLKECGWDLKGLETIALPAEREYGDTYLYGESDSASLFLDVCHADLQDLTPTIPYNETKQSIANLAIDMFNLNWSMLDADIALTKSVHGLVERISYWTQGDGLSVAASLRAAAVVTELLGSEDREGDVMLAIQAERLALLAVLLETGLDSENDQADTPLLKDLLIGVQKVLENSSFPPISSLRHPELPPLHRPILRILFLLFQSLAIHPKHDLQIDTMLEEAISFTVEAADVILDSVIRGQDSTGDLGLVIGSLCGMIKVVSTHVWLDKMSETNLIGRSLEIVTRTKVIDTSSSQGGGAPTFVPSQIPLVLLLHLALATNSLSAEKLAVSGVLSAYSDNSIALAAETASITPPIETAPYTIHGSWYSMLLVVKALLSSLPDTRSFIKSDVTPFIRVGTEQMVRALSWNGETPLTTSALDEMQITLDIFYGISQSVNGGSDGILSSIGPSLVDLLKGMREAFEHPLELSQTIIPSSEDEHLALDQELSTVMDHSSAVDLATLLDEKKVPTVSARVERLLRVTATAAMTLVNLTRVWPALKEGERNQDAILHSDVRSLIAAKRDVQELIM